MVTIKTVDEIELMKHAGHINNLTHQLVASHIKPGITTKELDKLAHDFIISKECIPSFLNYNGFPASICTSINEVVVHGIPEDRKLISGDIVSIDIGVCYKGYHSDAARTHAVGIVDVDKIELINNTKKAFFEGIKLIKPGNKLGDISSAIESCANMHNLGIVRELVGHGIGTHLHEEPDIPNYGKANTGLVLKEGMVLAIEPMLNLGSDDVCMLDDEWTIVTEDGKYSAHYENTVVVTKDGYEILTGEDLNG